MTQRERLIEIIQKSVGGCAEYWAGKIADGLIENDVIVPPCKTGDSVFWISAAGYIWEAKVKPGRGLFYAMTYADNGDEQIGCWYDPEDIGVSVFLTREEAEKALKEREEK